MDYRKTIDDGLYYSLETDGERIYTGQHVFVSFDGMNFSVFNVYDRRFYETFNMADLGTASEGRAYRLAQDIAKEYDNELEELSL